MATKASWLAGPRRLGGSWNRARLPLLARVARVPENDGLLHCHLAELPLERVSGFVVDDGIAPVCRHVGQGDCLVPCSLAGISSGGPDSSGLSSDRHNPARRAQRLFLVFHVDRSAAVLFPKPGMDFADDPAVSLVQDLHQLPRDWRVAI